MDALVVDEVGCRSSFEFPRGDCDMALIGLRGLNGKGQ